MAKYTLGVILDDSLENVLLIKKMTAPNEGSLNLIGGEIESIDTPLSSMIKEFFDCTGFKLSDTISFRYLLSESIPHLMSLDLNETHVFYFILKEKKEIINNDSDDLQLGWFNIDDHDLLRSDNPFLTGEGNLSYYINFAKCRYESQNNFSQPLVQTSNK